jgi:hypothetical protein
MAWNETQFATNPRLPAKATATEEILPPGTPFFIRSYYSMILGFFLE